MKHKKQSFQFICRHQPCDARFRLIEHLREHDRTHTHIQPYTCRKCNQQRTCQWDLKTHLRNDHFSKSSISKNLDSFVKVNQNELKREADEIDEWLKSEHYKRLLGQSKELSSSLAENAEQSLPVIENVDDFFQSQEEAMNLNANLQPKPISTSALKVPNTLELASTSKWELPSSPSSQSLTSSSAAPSPSAETAESTTFQADDNDERNPTLHSNAIEKNLGPLVLCRNAPKDGFKYVCQRPGCGKELSDITQLKHHDRIHRNVKPFKCIKCGNEFALKSNSVKHICKHHLKQKKIDQNTAEEFIEENKEQLQFEQALFASAEKKVLPPKNAEGADGGDQNDNGEENVEDSDDEGDGGNKSDEEDAEDGDAENSDDNNSKVNSTHPSETNSEYDGDGEKTLPVVPSKRRKKQKSKKRKQHRGVANGKFICRSSGCHARWGSFTHLRNHDRKHTCIRPYSCTLCESYISGYKPAVMQHIRVDHNKESEYRGAASRYVTVDEDLLQREIDEITEWLASEQCEQLLDRLDGSSSGSNRRQLTTTITRSEKSSSENEEEENEENVYDHEGDVLFHQTPATSFPNPSPSEVSSTNVQLSNDNTSQTPPVSPTSQIASLTCFYCKKTDYTSYGEYFQHDTTHDGLRPFVCTWTGCFRTLSVDQITTHFVQSHDPNGNSNSEDYIKECNDFLAEELARFDELEQSLPADENAVSQVVVHSDAEEDDFENNNKEANEENASSLEDLGPLVLCRTAPKDGSKYVCQRPGCGKELSDICSLKCHDRIHRNVKPFCCTWEGCGHKTAVQCNLEYHICKFHFGHSGTAAEMRKQRRSDPRDPEEFVEEDTEQLQAEKELFASAETRVLLPRKEKKADGGDQKDDAEEEEVNDVEMEENEDNVEDEEDSTSSDSDSSSEDSSETERIKEELRILKAQLAAVESKPFGCTFRKCRARFDDENVWRDHEREHFRVMAYTCIYPENVDDNEGNNLGEGTSTESEKKDKVCGKGFYALAKIQEHIRDDHISSKSIQFSDEHISQYIYIDPDFIKL